VLIPIGIAHGHHVLADHQVGRRTDGNHRELFGGRDLDDRQIRLWIVGDARGDVFFLVRQRDFDSLHAVDDVIVRQNVAPFVDDHAGAHPVDVLRLAAAVVFVARRERLLAVDVDDRRALRLDDFHGRRVAPFARRRTRRRARHAACDQSDPKSPGNSAAGADSCWHGRERLKVEGLDGRQGRGTCRLADPKPRRGRCSSRHENKIGPSRAKA
jgi:hypothetical protein